MSVRNKPSITRRSWQRSFFVALFFVTLAALLFWLETFHAYQSEMRVLVVGKVPETENQAIENLIELSKNLSFYERVLAGNDLIEDEFAGQAKDQRKKLWNETVTIQRSEKSGVLVVTARQDTPEKAKRLTEETVQTLFSVASFYYNIKTDIDLRIVDEPILETVVIHPIKYVLISFGSALGATVVFFGFLSFVPSLFGKPEEQVSPEYPIGASVPFIDPQKFVPARPTMLSFESSHDEQREMVSEAKEERMLPGMDAESLPFQFEEVPGVSPEASEQESNFSDLPVTGGFVADKVETPQAASGTAPLNTNEPTVEEYKRRLNQLLAGGR